MEFEPEALFESIARYLISLGVGDRDEKLFEVNRCGDYIRIRIKNNSGELMLKVVGKDYDELASQLVLACLHNVTFEHLGALHRIPLYQPPPQLVRVR